MTERSAVVWSMSVCGGGGGGILGQAEVKLGRSEWSKHAAPPTTPHLPPHPHTPCYKQ